MKGTKATKATKAEATATPANVVGTLAVEMRSLRAMQADYETRKWDHLNSTLKLKVLKEEEPAERQAAKDRCVAAGMTKTDAGSRFIEDAAYAKLSGKMYELEIECANADTRLSVARSRLLTQRVIVMALVAESDLATLTTSHD